MNRPLTLSVLALLLAGLAGPAAAADFALFGSWYDTSELDSSVGGGLKADFGLGASAWSFELRASYYPELGSDLVEFIDDTDVDISAFEISALPLDLGFTYGFGESRNVFLGGGATFVALDADRDLRIDDEVGWYLVLGFEGGEPGGGVAFFLEGLYRMMEGTVEGDLDDLTFFEFDSELDGFAVNVGAVWRF